MSEQLLHDAEQDRRVDYTEMAATSIADVKNFYTDAFGWKFTDYGPDYTTFEDGRLRVVSTRGAVARGHSPSRAGAAHPV